MAVLRLLLLVSLFFQPSYEGNKRYCHLFSKDCPTTYCIKKTVHPTENKNRFSFTLPIEDTSQILYVRPEVNQTSKLLLIFGGESKSTNLTAELRIYLWKGDVMFCAEALGNRKCYNHPDYFEIQTNDTVFFSIVCKTASHTSGPPKDVITASSSPSSVSAVDVDINSKTFHTMCARLKYVA
ncbi:uncharacterized protein LOC119594371 [Penaeus monodon]|uniref:uncharacterized protein LOC119594371 n=1 Tax=Penaeus monodon TaxID=6687 RepID=UPI0018A71C72|nr:uncharacterized protein LOC119594371 [Penaeus monodon]XP_037799359.1 uncharacterized protein LOC119594371 [Penaeus monodon]